MNSRPFTVMSPGSPGPAPIKYTIFLLSHALGVLDLCLLGYAQLNHLVLLLSALVSAPDKDVWGYNSARSDKIQSHCATRPAGTNPAHPAYISIKFTFLLIFKIHCFITFFFS